MKITFIIPVFNEEKTILKILKLIDRCDTLFFHKQIIIVDDGSHDNSRNIIQQWIDLKKKIKSENNWKAIFHNKNLGKGEAIKSGIKKASGDLVIIQDADLEYDPKDISKMIRKSIGKLAQPNDQKTKNQVPFFVVYGVRKDRQFSGSDFMFAIGSYFVTFFFNLVFSAKLSDIYTGYKLIPTAILKKINLTASGFEIEAEITSKIFIENYVIKEVEVTYSPRDKKHGKHITYFDGLRGIWQILKVKITYKGPTLLNSSINF